MSPIKACLALAFCGLTSLAQSPSGEGYTIERLSNRMTFAADGTAVSEQSARVKVLSEAGVQQLGVLKFTYRSDSERVEAVRIRVTKPDGNSVDTPESSIQDLDSEVTRIALTYSDTREKQIPVRALSAGDVLEWSTRVIRTKSDVPGHFWFTYDFTKNAVVLDEELEVSVPADKYVKVASPSLTPELKEKDGQRIYLWKTSHPDPPKADPGKRLPLLRPVPVVQLTTFQNWEEVGRWYGALINSKIEVTPAIRAKALELTRGLKSNEEKQRAIYQFVASKLRYVSISFGAGRYQPHSADDVLANQYGDCKDQNTLFIALAKAVGIDAWPALIGAGIDFDPDMPSPLQFNHVVTYIPQDAEWLDTTPGVAPYGMLSFVLRGHAALLIPGEGAPRVAITPENGPISEENVDVKGKLSPEGTLTSHVNLSVSGDSGIALRDALRRSAPAQRTALAQSISISLGLGGDVKNVLAENIENPDAPLHFSYDFQKADYSDWANRRIALPLPQLRLSYPASDDKSPEPVQLGPIGKRVYQVTIELPEGYSVKVPAFSDLKTSISEYASSYSFDGKVLTASRRLDALKTKVTADQFEEYRNFARAVTASESQLVQFARLETSTGPRIPLANADAAGLVRKGLEAVQAGDSRTAREALQEAERLNPRQTNLWLGYGSVYFLQNLVDDAFRAFQKEIEFHPDNLVAYLLQAARQAQLGRFDDEIETLKLLAKNAPADAAVGNELWLGLLATKRYPEIIDSIHAALKENPNNLALRVQLVRAELLRGNKQAGLALIAEMRKAPLEPFVLNDFAYILADTDTDLDLAKNLGEQAIGELESQLKQLTLSTIKSDQLAKEITLGAAWDTLGWAYFKSGDLAKARAFVNAGWLMNQTSTEADHLGQIYERQGNSSEAIHYYQLALAVQPKLPETSERLNKLVSSAPASDVRQNTLEKARQELPRLRATPLPGLNQTQGSAEYMMLFSKAGVEEVRFLKGDEALKGKESDLLKSHYNVAVPDDGGEKFARKGFLSCSKYTTPNCQLVLMPPADSRIE